MPAGSGTAGAAAGVVLVLSGGGAKAAAHIGAWRALAEAGLAPERVVATSMGAVLGAALAAGITPDRLLDQLVTIGARGIVRRRLAPLGGLWLRSLLRPAPFRSALEALVPARRFDELRPVLTVTAVDLDSGALVAFGAGGRDVPLLDALTASCALPLYYPGVTLDGRRYGDGGLRAVLPIELAGGEGTRLVVAVDVGPGFDESTVTAAGAGVPPLVRAHNDATGILMAGTTALQLALWAATPGRPSLVHVRPAVERDATFRVDRVLAYAEEGYRATRASLAARR